MTRIARGPAIDTAANAMTEAQLQEAVTGIADAYKITWHHEQDSRRSKRGLPDLILCGSRLEFWELKRQNGKPTPEQHKWLLALVRAGVKARIIRPLDLLNGTVQDALRDLRTDCRES